MEHPLPSPVNKTNLRYDLKRIFSPLHSQKLLGQPLPRKLCKLCSQDSKFKVNNIVYKSISKGSPTNNRPCVLSAAAWSSELNSRWDTRSAFILSSERRCRLLAACHCELTPCSQWESRIHSNHSINRIKTSLKHYPGSKPALDFSRTISSISFKSNIVCYCNESSFAAMTWTET